MNKLSQPWVINWYSDILGFFLAPFVFLTMGFFRVPPFDGENPRLLENMIFLVLFLDWAHIFAQYPRIYSNPLESKRLKWIYPISYILLIPIMTFLVHLTGGYEIDTFLVYFVVFHFIKQQFGFIKIFSKTDGLKSKFDKLAEDIFFYLTMYAPVFYWHVKGPNYAYKWIDLFFKPPFLKYLLWPVLGLYLVSFVYYLYSEVRRTRANGMFNIPKNLSILTAAMTWGAVSLFPDAAKLVIFTVTFTHDLSYTYFVWAIGRRDRVYVKKKIEWLSWTSVPGFFLYTAALIVLSDIIMVIHMEMTKDQNWTYWVWGHTFNWITKQSGWMLSLGWAIFFSTQAHHYFIDRFLWKKEKDMEFMVKTGRIKLNDLS